MVFFLFCTTAKAQQDDRKIFDDAEKLMREGQFDVALKAFEHVRHLPDVAYKATICSLLSNRIKNLPVERYLAFSQTHKEDPLYYYWLGKIYLKRMNAPEAQSSLRRFLTSANLKTADVLYQEEAKRILTCLQAPAANFAVVPVESPLNSTFAEINGILYDDHKKFVFASDRNSEGHFGIYFTARGQYGWNTPEVLHNFLATDREHLNLLPVRDTFFFYDSESAELYFIKQTETGWSEPILFETKVLADARHIYINKYENRLVFSSEDDENGLDIYESVKLRTTGQWTPPLSISDELNSPYNEDYPFLSEDRTRLYFCSDRPGGLGKMDIYYSEYDEVNSRWGKAKNMGMPINSMDDDIDFKILNEQEGLFSSDRMTSRGDLDVFLFRRD